VAQEGAQREAIYLKKRFKPDHAPLSID